MSFHHPDSGWPMLLLRSMFVDRYQIFPNILKYSKKTLLFSSMFVDRYQTCKVATIQRQGFVDKTNIAISQCNHQRLNFGYFDNSQILRFFLPTLGFLVVCKRHRLCMHALHSMNFFTQIAYRLHMNFWRYLSNNNAFTHCMNWVPKQFS